MDEDEVAVRSQILRKHIHEIEELIERLLPAAKAGSTSDRDQIVSLQRQVFAKRERLRTLPAEEI
jgi:hypothetical protein